MQNSDRLKFQMPAQGWQQFLAERKSMLNAFDIARTHSKKHKVETSHGNVAEAEFRRWLGDFLPKRYAVTSGYIISPGISDLEKSPHFDVIIYEHLDSPILWIENNPDASKQGRSLAIPAEHVRAVIEVKSSFERRTVREAIDHFKELRKLLSGIDAQSERYKLHLPINFFWGLVFFDLKNNNERDFLALESLIEAVDLRGFYGGIILRGEGHAKDYAGKLNLVRSELPMTAIPSVENSLLYGLNITKSREIRPDQHIGAMLQWMEPNFSGFAFDIVALLNGTYEQGRVSSFQAFGTSEWAEAAARKASPSD